MQNPNASDVPSDVDLPSPEEQLSGDRVANQAFEPDYRLFGAVGLDADTRELLNEGRSGGSEETARQSASSRDLADVGSPLGPVVARVGETSPKPVPAPGLGGGELVSATPAQGSVQKPSGSSGVRVEVDEVELIPDYSQLPEHPAAPSSWTGRAVQPGVSQDAVGYGPGGQCLKTRLEQSHDLLLRCLEVFLWMLALVVVSWVLVVVQWAWGQQPQGMEEGGMDVDWSEGAPFAGPGGPVLESQNAQIRASESISQRALCDEAGGTEILPPPLPPPASPHPKGMSFGERAEDVRVSISELPKLEVKEHERDLAPLLSGDWLAMISPAMKDISPTSSTWWSQVVHAATSYYQEWLMCDPVTRLSLQPTKPYRFEHTKYARVEQRALTMLLRAVPTVIREELVANRKLSCIELIALIHTTYQPGGLKERAALLRYLTNPDGCTEPVAALRSIKRWSRWKCRAAELHISTPDPTLLLGGVDTMVSKVFAQYPEAQFRISSYRFAKSVDHQPTEAKIVELVRFVQGELETLVSSGTVKSKSKADGDADAGKRLRVAKVEDPEAKGKGRTRDDTSKGAEGKGKEICKHWRTDKGCKFAKACRFAHDPLLPSEKRCFACSALNHMRSECPYQPKDGRASDAHKGKGKGSETIAKASAQASTPSSSSNPVPASQSSCQAPATEPGDILKKAAAMIETLQTSIKTVADGYGRRPGGNDPTGLIDSGASACMRAKVEGDVVTGVRVVSLAQGEAEVEVNQAGTLLTSQPIEPIVSARHLIKCGFKITWSRRAFLLLDPQGVAVPAVIQAGCPRVTRSVALSLIDFIEKTSLEEGAAVEDSVRVARALCTDGTDPWPVGMAKLKTSCEDGDLVKAQAWHRITLQSLFPEVPRDLVDSASSLVPPEGVKGVLNRRRRREVVLLLRGHERRKPTTIASTFDDWPEWCREVKGAGCGSGIFWQLTCQFRSMFMLGGGQEPVAENPDKQALSAREEPAEWEQAGDYKEPDAKHKKAGELLPEEGVDEDSYLSKVKMVNIPFGIPLKDKGAQEVLRALKLIDARASCLGIKIARFHSDKGAEFDNRYVRDWAASRGIWKSSTGGDNWRSNGAAEALVGILKDSVRVLLRDAQLGPKDWPYALRHAAGRLFQSRVKMLGWDLPSLVPFGAKVFVHRRTWHLKKDADKEWAAKAVEARVLAPALEIDGGYLVRTVRDELYNTSCVYENVEYLDPARFVIPEDKATEAIPLQSSTRRRYRAKTTVASVHEDPEDLKAQELVDTKPFPLTAAVNFLLGSSWIRTRQAKQRYNDSSPSLVLPLAVPPLGGGIWAECPDGTDVRLEQVFKASTACASDEAQGRGSMNLGRESVVVPSVDTSQTCAGAEAQGGGSVVVDEGLVGDLNSSLARELIAPANLARIGQGNDEALGLSKAWVAGRGPGCLGVECGACVKDSAGVCSLCERDVLSVGRSLKASPSLLGRLEDGSFVDGVFGEGFEGPFDALDARQPGVGVQVEGSGACGSVGSAGRDDSRIACLRKAECGALGGTSLSGSGLGKVVPSLLPFFPDTWQLYESGAFEGDEDEGSVSLGLCPGEVDPEVSLRNLKGWLSDEGRAQCRQHADVSQRCQAEDAIRHAVVRKILELEQASCAKAGEELEYSLLPDAEVLCTHTVPLIEVERYYDLWKEALEKELHSMIDEKQALRVISEAELTKYQEAGTRAMIIPSKLVCTRKSGGRFKARLVACGNYVDLSGKDGESRSASVDLYAGGIDAAVLRQVLALAVKKRWSAGSTDVSTAFLNAELLDRQSPLTKPAPLSQQVPSEIVVLRPPSLLVKHGLVPPRSFMLVLRAVYGLDQSPRDWGIRRDKDLRTVRLMLGNRECRLVMSAVDNNLWFLTTGCKSDPVMACLMVYVDDLLATGPLAVIRPLLAEISKLWQCGAVSFLPENTSEVPLVFFGYEIRRVGRSLHLSQRDYVTELATRYRDLPAPSTPLPPGTLDIPPAEVQSASDLKQCQAMLGEALWVSTRTRPDVGFAVSRLSQAMSKNAAAVRPLCIHLLGYLYRTKDFGLLYTDQYPAQGETGSVASVNGKYVVEAQTDAAFAPTCERSHEATMVYSLGSLTGWLSTRQPFVAASTAEAELLSVTTGFSYGRSQRFVIEEIEGCKVDLRILNDNLAATTICNAQSTNWRTRHLRIRAAHLRQQISDGECSVSHVPGECNTADLGTKALQPSRFERLRAMMGVLSFSEVTARERTSSAVVSSGPPVEEALRVIVAALCVASAKGQPLSDGSDDFVFWRVVLLWSVFVIVAWEMFRWGCRVCYRKLTSWDMPQPDPEASESEREQEPDEEDLLEEADRPQHDAEPRDEDPGVMPFRYIDDVVYVAPHSPTPAHPTEREQQAIGQAGVRRRHALRVYAPEPGDEPPPHDRGVGSEHVLRAVEREWAGMLTHQVVVRVSDLAPLPSFQGGGPLGHLVEVRERAEVLYGMLNRPPLIPIVLHPHWPPPPQLTVRELRMMASEWGGPASSLHQEPPPAYHTDQYIYVPEVRPRVLVRWHMRPRVRLFSPVRTTAPIPLTALTGARRTLQEFVNGDRVIWDDHFMDPDHARRHEDQQWRGRTEFEVDLDELARLQGRDVDPDEV
ncbi:RE2 [Symbiodinium natans]|uniref:RE2 protein n=1 Tax=Symbiodinium natans TaxID=878477 RepID=A0A812NFI8_9DINO|nr:RE2 [Symbiodinium natans]